jgi:uncharacterized protein YhfF
MWPRVAGLRGLALGLPGPARDELNALVVAGRKTATAGLLQEYAWEGEQLEHVGEQLALLDGSGAPLRIVEVTRLEIVPFVEVGWDFALAEGEGHTSIEDWRRSRLAIWAAVYPSTRVDDDTEVVCRYLRVVPRS